MHLLISDDVDLLISQALTARSSSQALATSHTGLTWSKLHGAIANLQEVFCRQFLMRKNCFCTSVIRGTMKTPSLHCQTANDVHVYVASGQKNVLQAGHLFEYILQNVGSCPRVSDSKEAWRRRQEQSPARPSVRPCVRPSDRPLVRPSDHLSDRPSVRPRKKTHRVKNLPTLRCRRICLDTACGDHVTPTHMLMCQHMYKAQTQLRKCCHALCVDHCSSQILSCLEMRWEFVMKPNTEMISELVVVSIFATRTHALRD